MPAAYVGTAHPAAEALLRYAMSDGGTWPLKRERPILNAINTWIALRESDCDQLRKVRPSTDARRSQRIDALPDRISVAWAGFVIGDEPAVLPADDNDIELMADLLGDDFASELSRAVELCVSEGEDWARIYLDPMVAPRPLLDWVSRVNVLPLWAGPRLVAAAVITELPPMGDDDKLYRHFEVHAPGVVVNALFAGSADNLGERLAPGLGPDAMVLDAHDATADVREVWAHGLPFMLLERIPNRIRRDRRIGVSDYAGILDQLLDLNEIASIGAHNMKLTARKRAMISEAVARRAMNGYSELSDSGTTNSGLVIPRPRFSVDEEVFVEDPLDNELGKDSTPFKVLEYTFDAEPLIAWQRNTVEVALTRIGLSPQYVGVTTSDSEGYAISGTALRLRLIPTDTTGNKKARYWDDGVPDIIHRMMRLSALPEEQGGLGWQWADLETAPTFRRTAGIPVDQVEQATTQTALVGAGLLSVETSLRERYPDAGNDWIDKEVERIRADQAASPRTSMLPGF